MRKALRIILVVTVSLILLLLGRHFYERSRQPKYAGRTLSDWFEQYHRSGEWGRWDPPEHDEAAKALQAIGTNAIPFLLEEAFTTRQDSAMRTNLNKLMLAFPASLHLPSFASPNVKRTEAGFAIKFIKPPAGIILPVLEQRLVMTGKDRRPRQQALFLLGCIGADAEKGVPYLIAALTNANPTTRIMGLQSLKWIGPQAGAAVPEVISMLSPTNSAPLQMNAVRTLGAIGSNATSALLGLKEMFARETRPNERATIAVALCQIDNQQTEALQVLLEPIHDQKQPARRKAGIAKLWELGPSARVAIPDLVQLLEHTSADEWTAVARLLKKLEASPELYVPKLEQKLKSDDQDTRNNAALVLIQVAPGNTEAMNYLIKCLEPDSPLQMLAVGAFENAGPAAKAAIPALRQALKAKSNYVRETAAKALKSIEAEEVK